jgi:hypothetical protein
MGVKPDDWRVLPLCQWCHLDSPSSQHKIGEDKFYKRIGIDPLEFAKVLYESRNDLTEMRRIILSIQWIN